MKRLPLFFSLLALIALSASIAYWVMQLYKPPQRRLAAAPVASMPEPGIDAAATLFGGQAAAAVATNYRLTGVVAAGRDSVAILVADGTPPKALKIGKEIVDGVTVKEVHPRYVMLSEGGVLKRIDLATDAKAGNGLSPPVALPGGSPGTASSGTASSGGASPGGPPPGAVSPTPGSPGMPGTVAPPPPAPAQMPPATRTVVTPGSQPPNE
jgi:general secretion pathway protein C